MTDKTKEPFDYAKLDRMLDRTKAELFCHKNAAFFGPLLCSLEFQWDESIETAATDGLKIYWNPEDFLGCTPKGRVSSLLHELGHVYRMHNQRRDSRDQSIWNQAGDIVINRDLIEDGIGIDGWHKQGIGECKHIKGTVEEDIYDELNKNKNPKPPPGMKCCDSGSKPTLTGAQAAQAVNIVVQAVNEAQVRGDPGAIPGSIKDVIKDFLAPKVPWQHLLYEWMTELLDDDFSWQKPNRRYQNQGMYLPSRFTDDGRLQHLICYQDVSGSVGKADSVLFNSELKFIWDTFKPEKLTIVQFDTRIQKVDELEEGDSFDEVEIKGRGGTCLKCVRAHMEKHEPTAAIIFSDLYVAPMEPIEVPTIWIAVGNKAATVKFGKLIHVRP